MSRHTRRRFGWATLLALTIPSLILAQETEKGFRSLFDGQTLRGCDGDERFWRVEDGAIIGQTTPDNAAEHNTFLIYSLTSKVRGENGGTGQV